MHRRVRRRALVATAVLTLALFYALLAACPARADEVVDADVPVVRWYGWQTLLGDGAATFFAFGASSNGSAAVAAYGLGGPLVHLVHDRPEAALASIGLRVGLPAMGYVLGSGLDCSEQRATCRTHLVPVWGPLLAIAGIPAAMAIDAAVLARAPGPEPRSKYVQHLSPAVAPRKEGGFDVALQGAF
jgi:hypothetical protein